MLHRIALPSLVAASAVTLVPPTPLLAQTATVVPVNQRQGMLTGQPAGVQIGDSPTPSGPDSTFRIRTTGVQAGQLRPWTIGAFGQPTTLFPSYSEQSMFAHWAPGFVSVPPAPQTVPVWTEATLPEWSASNPNHTPSYGGMSSGGDITPPVNASGVIQYVIPEAVFWYSLSFSVASTPEMGNVPATPTGPLFPAIGVGTDNPDGWIFSYMADGSTNIFPDMEDTVRAEYTGSQLGLATDEGLNALDWGFGLISETRGSGVTAFQPERTLFYFTLDHEWLETYCPGPGAWQFTGAESTLLGAPRVWIEANATTVYVMEWNEDAWSLPAVAVSTAELFGDQTVVGAIDALSVYRRPFDSANDPSRVVFSLTADSTLDGAVPNQILVTQTKPSGVLPVTQAVTLQVDTDPGPLVDPQPITEKVGITDSGPGIGPDEVDALCGRDPREGQFLDPLVGTPGTVIGPDPGGDLGLSVFRYQEVGENEDSGQRWLLNLSGIDLTGYPFGAVFFDIEILSDVGTSFPLPFAPGLSQVPFPLPAGSSIAEFDTAFQEPEKGDVFGIQARVYGVNYPSLVPDFLDSTWVSFMRL